MNSLCGRETHVAPFVQGELEQGSSDIWQSGPIDKINTAIILIKKINNNQSVQEKQNKIFPCRYFPTFH